jgi:hypothetical protein
MDHVKYIQLKDIGNKRGLSMGREHKLKELDCVDWPGDCHEWEERQQLDCVEHDPHA